MSKTHRDNQDDDERIVKDGHSVRVPMFAMDSMQKSVRQASARQPAARITAADGSTLGLHRPGYRLSSTITCAHSHYDAYEADVTNAWKGNPPTNAAERGQVGQREGDPCTIDGFPGHLRMINGNLTCVADARGDAMHDERASAYQEYQNRIQNAWRDWR